MNYTHISNEFDASAIISINMFKTRLQVDAPKNFRSLQTSKLDHVVNVQCVTIYNRKLES
jgi:hypothetical protein